MGGGISRERLESLRAEFAAMDTRHDGHVSLEQLQAAHHAHDGAAYDEAAVLAEFEKLDSKHHGYVVLHEYLEAAGVKHSEAMTIEQEESIKRATDFEENDSTWFADPTITPTAKNEGGLTAAAAEGTDASTAKDKGTKDGGMGDTAAAATAEGGLLAPSEPGGGLGTNPSSAQAAEEAEGGDVLTVDTFDVDATADDLVGLLSAPTGWAKIVPGFEDDCEVVLLEESQGFRMTTAAKNWMWLTDMSTEKGAVFSVRITVTDPEENPGQRPTSKLFSVIQTWTLTPKDKEAGDGNGGCTVERKFTQYDGSDELRGFLLGGMIAKENQHVRDALARKA